MTLSLRQLRSAPRPRHLVREWARVTISDLTEPGAVSDAVSEVMQTRPEQRTLVMRERGRVVSKTIEGGATPAGNDTAAAVGVPVA
ncbi:MAG: hypothetical protein H0U32_05475 [Thermoleophilaceae bacterium]|nr:hypothetical protein [Thermoleophilaceae bacterium]